MVFPLFCPELLQQKRPDELLHSSGLVFRSGNLQLGFLPPELFLAPQPVILLQHGGIAKGQLQIFGCQGSAQSDVFGRYSARSGCFPPLLRLIYIIHLSFSFLYDANVEIAISFIPFMVILLQNQILAIPFYFCGSC